MGNKMPENFEIVNHLIEENWQNFIYQNPQSNIFHTPEMFTVFKNARNHLPNILAIVEADGNPIAFFPSIQVTLWNGVFKRLTSRSISYGGLLLSPNLNEKFLVNLLLQAHTENLGKDSLFTEIRNLSDMTAYQPEFKQCGFSYEEHLNFLIDLDCSTEEIMNRIGSRTRHHIRRGLRKGLVVIDEISQKKQLGVWYNIIQKTYKSAQVPLADISLFESAFDVLYSKNMVKFLLARVGSDYVAASAELLYKDIIYGWYGGMDRTYTKYTPGELLMWHILEWGALNGYKVYDFGGAGKPDEEFGVREFKAKFGGKQVCFGRNTRIHAPKLLNLSQKGYSIYRRMI